MTYVPKPDLDGINAPPSSPLRDLAFMGLGFVTIILVVFLIFGVAGEWALTKMSPDTEATLFGKLGMAISKADLADPAIQTVFQKLNLISPKPFKVYTICDETPNALAMPGGTILLTSGLLEKVKTEKGLAFVIAHEMGHFAGRHHIRGFGRTLGVTLAAALLGLADNSFATNTLMNLVGSSYSREQETEADNFALDLVIKAYGDLENTTEFFESLTPGQKMGEKIAGLMSTHPMTEDRIENIRRHQKQLHPISDKAAVTLTWKHSCKD